MREIFGVSGMGVASRSLPPSLFSSFMKGWDMIKVKQSIDFECTYASVGWSMDHFEFTDKQGNSVTINCNKESFADFGLRLILSVLKAHKNKGLLLINRDDAVSLVNAANNYLKATEPVES